VTGSRRRLHLPPRAACFEPRHVAEPHPRTKERRRPTLGGSLAAAFLGSRAGLPAAPSGSGEGRGGVGLARRRLGFGVARAARAGGRRGRLFSSPTPTRRWFPLSGGGNSLASPACMALLCSTGLVAVSMTTAQSSLE
jgi:hypothetical protein